MKEYIRLENVKIVNPVTKRSIVLKSITINFRDCANNVIRAMLNASYTDNTIFAMLLPSEELKGDLQRILNERTVLNTPKSKL